MSDLSAADIAARVVAWHNRHPLARRLALADVHSVGHVALPFLDPAAEAPPAGAATPGAGSLRERAMARAREAPGPPAAGAPQPDTAAAGPLQPAFRDDFIPPLAPAEVGAFAARHGIERAADPGGAPVRRVPPQPGAHGLAWRWVLTAELRADGARTRVLLGPVPGAPVLGRRLWSLPRVGALAALSGAGVALVLALGLLDGGGTPAPMASWSGATPATADAAASAPVTVAAMPSPSASAAAPAADPPTRSPGDTPTDTPTDAATPAAAASRPIDVEPRLGRVTLPPIGGIVDARRREAAERAAAASAAAASAPATAAVPAAGPGPAAAAPPAAAASAPVFALATRPLRTRTETQQIAEALRALLVVPGSPVQRVDILPAGDDFRVVAWPYPDRDAAARAQSAMQARGHRLQLIAF